MKTIKLWALAIILLAIGSCSKEQAALNKLNGIWQITEYNENGTLVPIANLYIRWHFPKCDTKSDYCSLEMLNNSGGISQTEMYRLSPDVKWFLMRNNTLQKDDSLEILSLSLKKFVIKSTSSSSNDYVIMSFAKE